MSVSGLTVGKEYLFQAYWETNNIAGAVLEATIEGNTKSGIVALADKFTNPGGTMISYQFVAGDDTLNASFNRTDSVTNDWLSGYSLQEIPKSFSNWIAGFPEAGGQTGFIDDPDGDRLANGLEAWFGTHPGKFNAGLANLTFDGATTITFSHPQNPDPPSDVTGFYQWSVNLTDWYAGDGIDGPPDGPAATISPVTVGTTTNVTVITSEIFTTLFLRAGATQN
jgi:hypothetical protein